MTNPLISVIVPVYKVETYLDKCVSSIVNQTYKNLDIILVDDGSPDNCPEMCENWAKKDNRISVVHKANGGLADARNAGLEVMKGEYVVFIDSDDWVDCDFVEHLYKELYENEADVACCDFYYDYLDRETRIIGTEKYNISDGILKNYLLDNIRPEVCSKIYSKDIIGDLRFDTENKYSEDVPFNYFICKKCRRIINSGIPKYHYLQNSGNSLTTPYITKARAASYRIYVNFVKDCTGDDELYYYAVRRLTVSVLAIVSRVLTNGEITDLYYSDIVNAFKKYKKDILNNKDISSRHKLIVILMTTNKTLFKHVYRRLRPKTGA